MNVLVLHSQVPYTRGGAEVLVEGLAAAMRERGHEVDTVALPLAWDPVERLLTTALAWRLLDLSSFNGRDVDVVICTKYPTWAVNHPNKVLWLIHQHRQAYDLHGTEMSEFGPDPASRAVRDRVWEIDRRGLSECTRRYAISKNVSNRLAKFNGISSEALYPPVPRAGLTAESFESFILSVARIDSAKRVERVVNAWRYVESDLRLVVAGDGPGLDDLSAKVRDWRLESRVQLLGRVSDDRLRNLYNNCRAVFYAPLDEDYGYTAVEALAAGKPVVTSADSGGVLEFVSNCQTGLVSSLEGRELAAAVDRLADEGFARSLGSAGPRVTSELTWDNVVSALLGT